MRRYAKPQSHLNFSQALHNYLHNYHVIKRLLNFYAQPDWLLFTIWHIDWKESKRIALTNYQFNINIPRWSNFRTTSRIVIIITIKRLGCFPSESCAMVAKCQECFLPGLPVTTHISPKIPRPEATVLSNSCCAAPGCLWLRQPLLAVKPHTPCLPVSNLELVLGK